MSDFTVHLQDKMVEECIERLRFFLIDIEKTVGKELYYIILSEMESEIRIKRSN